MEAVARAWGYGSVDEADSVADGESASLRRTVDAVLAALAEAGRLLPEDTRTEWSFAYPDGVVDGKNFTEEGARRYAEDFGGQVVRRWVGPWVPVPTPPEPYRAASIARDGRRPCGECGPGYWIGDEGCQHTELAGPVVGAGMDVAGQPTAGAQTYATDTQTGPAGVPEEKTR